MRKGVAGTFECNGDKAGPGCGLRKALTQEAMDKLFKTRLHCPRCGKSGSIVDHALSKAFSKLFRL